MTKWRRRSDEYKVKVTYDKRGQATNTVPKPLIEIFGKPETLTFKLGNEGVITVEFTKSTANLPRQHICQTCKQMVVDLD